MKSKVLYNTQYESNISELKYKQEDLSCDLSWKDNHDDMIKMAGKRRKRLWTPLFYFLVELGIIWLLLSLFDLTFDIRE